MPTAAWTGENEEYAASPVTISQTTMPKLYTLLIQVSVTVSGSPAMICRKYKIELQLGIANLTFGYKSQNHKFMQQKLVLARQIFWDKSFHCDSAMIVKLKNSQ